MAEFRRPGQTVLDQHRAQALAAPVLGDRDRPQQQGGQPAADGHRPVADGALKLALLDGDEAQAGDRRHALAQAIDGLGGSAAAEGKVEKGFDGSRMLRLLGDDLHDGMGPGFTRWTGAGRTRAGRRNRPALPALRRFGTARRPRNDRARGLRAGGSSSQRCGRAGHGGGAVQRREGDGDTPSAARTPASFCQRRPPYLSRVHRRCRQLTKTYISL